MRQILFGLALAHSCLCLLAQKEPMAISSKIERVTVFLQGAQVERSAKQYLPAGKYNIFFDGISPKIEKQSIQLKADGQLTVLSVTHQLNFLKEQQVHDEIKQLEVQKEATLDKIGMEKNMEMVYKQDEQMILKNQSIKGDNATLKASELKEVADFQRQRLTEIYQRLQENQNDLKKMDGDLQKLNRQLSELNQKKDLSTSEITVFVDVKESGSVSFHLTYLVKQSAWFPTYDVRVQDISKPITLQMKANIDQQSGEDWKDVKLFLSTGNPNENGTRPTLAPWYLKYYYPVASTRVLPAAVNSELYGSASPNVVVGVVTDDKGSPLAGASVMAKGTNTAVMTDASGIFSLTLPAEGSTIVISSVGFASQDIKAYSGFTNITMKPIESRLQEVLITGYTSSESSGNNGYGPGYKGRKEKTDISTTTLYQPTTTIFEIADPYTVPNDGKVYTVDINSYELNALYEYYSAPKLDPSAYLTAKITDWQELNLLPGQANLFFEGTYLGNSRLDVMNAADTLKLSLGKDKGIVVKRTLNKEFSQKKFLGSNKTDSRQYEITIRNNKQQPVNIIIEDQLPISTNKDIEVEKISFEGGKLDDNTKAITWNLTIDEKKEVKLQLGYSVKYPRDKTLSLE